MQSQLSEQLFLWITVLKIIVIIDFLWKSREKSVQKQQSVVVCMVYVSRKRSRGVVDRRGAWAFSCVSSRRVCCIIV